MQQLSNKSKTSSQNPSTIHPKFIRKSFKIHPKSIQNQGKIDLASRMHFRSGPRHQKGGRTIPATVRFGSHFQPENGKSKLR